MPKKKAEKGEMMKLFENNYRSMFKLTSDKVFYWVYGMDTEESRKALISLLNVVLERKADPIVDVRLTNPVQKGYSTGDKETAMDIRCETQDGEQIDVEMQSGNLPFYPERSVFYGGKLINSALEEGEEYDKMKKSIVITFVNGILFHKISKVHTKYVLKENSEEHVLTEVLSMHFVELGKIKGDRPVEELSPVEKLAAYMKYCGEPKKEDYVSQLLQSGEEAVEMSEHVFKKLTEDDIARGMLERQERAARDRISEMSYMRREGLSEGIQKTVEVLKLSAKGMDAEAISEKVELPLETVKEILESDI